MLDNMISSKGIEGYSDDDYELGKRKKDYIEKFGRRFCRNSGITDIGSPCSICMGDILTSVEAEKIYGVEWGCPLTPLGGINDRIIDVTNAYLLTAKEKEYANR